MAGVAACRGHSRRAANRDRRIKEALSLMRLRALATGLVVSSAALGLLAGGGVLAAKHHASKRPATSQSKFLKWVAAKKTVDLTLIASYPGPGGPFSFDGYGGGKMTITVPLGARVDVTFSNHG